MKMLEVLNGVLVQAMKKEPLAWLYEVQFIMAETDGQVHPNNLLQMKIVFGMPENCTLIYDIDKNGAINESVAEAPWLEDRPLPHGISDGPEAAFERMSQANLAYDKVFPNAVLRFPLNLEAIEPVYIFHVDGNKDEEFVSVGLYSSNVGFIK